MFTSTAVPRSDNWGKLLREVATISLRILRVAIIGLSAWVILVLYYFIAGSDKPNKEFLIREYNALAAFSEEIYVLKRDTGICGESLAYLEMINRTTPESLWSKKHLSEKQRLEVRYWKLRAGYHELALEYNRRHEAVGYRFMYYKKLPEGKTETLPKIFGVLK